jgi:hypothetical protein
MDPLRRGEPLGYYYRTSPIGDVLLSRGEARRRVAVIGLGAGALACYARPGEHWTLYEINPVVEIIARDPRFFTYLADSEGRGAKLQVILGDARLRLAEAREAYDIIVIDAFSSDSIPVHLLTREALALYQSKLAPGGIVAIHITNKYLKLAPVVADLAADAGLMCFCRQELVARDAAERQRDAEETRQGKNLSDWAVLVRRLEDVPELAADSRWQHLSAQTTERVWTDDYSNLAGVLDWRGR